MTTPPACPPSLELSNEPKYVWVRRHRTDTARFFRNTWRSVEALSAKSNEISGADCTKTVCPRSKRSCGLIKSCRAMKLCRKVPDTYEHLYGKFHSFIWFYWATWSFWLGKTWKISTKTIVWPKKIIWSYETFQKDAPTPQASFWSGFTFFYDFLGPHDRFCLQKNLVTRRVLKQKSF